MTTSIPFFAFIAYSGYLFGYNALILHYIKCSPVRMDYIPNLKKINIERLTWYGGIRNELWDLKDIEKMDYEENRDRYNYYYMIHKHSIDREMMFRNKVTGAELHTRKLGKWNW
jgi:hypothetical protein